MFDLRPYGRNSMNVWNPFSEMEEMEKRFFNNNFFSSPSLAEFKTDITDEGDHYTLKADLPGFKKDEIKVSLEDGYLTIEAAKGLDEDEQEKKSGKYIRKERYAGSCQRSFYVGDNLTQEDIKGEFKHGILTLNVPKKEAKPAVETNKYIAIEG